MVLFSIIVPVYNSEKRLKKCIDSILSQTISDFELILIDDGSTDSSSEICDEYGNVDNRIRVIHKPNTGVSDSRNRGIENAIGKWVVFIDSDDTVQNTFLSNFHLDYDIEFQSVNVFSGNDESFSSMMVYEDESICSDCASKILLKGVNTAPWAKCFRRSIINSYNIGFPKEISYGEDSIFLFEYLSHCSTAYYNSAIGYNYYVFETGLGHKRHPIESLIKMYEMQYEQYSRILSKSNRRRYFLHKKTLSAVRELMLWYQESYQNLRKFAVIDHITTSYLYMYERFLLYIPRLFYKYCSFYFKIFG